MYLCASAVITLQNPIVLTAADQSLQTIGLPQGDTRALIVVAGANQVTAIFGNCNTCGGVSLRNIQVEGSRETLGFVPNGASLIELGGITGGQVSRAFLISLDSDSG